jgi:hexosaminidase
MIFTLLLFAALPAVAFQSSQPFDTKALAINWEPVKNDDPKTGQSLNAITITNQGKETLPASGWKMYFNSARMILPQSPTGNVSIEFLNGDLFRFTPLATFGELKPGASVRIEFVDEDQVVTMTDGPEGFYLVWDAQPERGYNTGKFSVKPFKPEYKGLITPEMIYNQNKLIQNIPEEALTKVFPTPVEYRETGGNFVLDKQIVFSTDKRFDKEGVSLKNDLESLIGERFSTDRLSSTIKMIAINFSEAFGPEGYQLTVKSNGIIISASTAAGAFYGIQSLKTLIPPAALAKSVKSIDIPCVEVKDEPRFAYRGFMLDVGRNFQPKSEVLKVLEVMALYKLNIFHFHITDDEGWRLQIAALPELTAVGAKRGHTLNSKTHLPASHGSGGETDQTTGSGFYTRQDYIDILRFANDRHITVVTEIETPGHARAAIKAMNARYARLMAEGKKTEAEKYLLSAPGDQSVYSSNQYWNDNVMDVSLPSTYHFLETVVGELIGMYKEAGALLSTIHFGGDEVPAGVWEKSPAYLALRAAHPEIKGTSDLWYYYYGRVNQLLKTKGLNLAGWEEMALRKTMLDGRPTYLPNPDFGPEHLQAEVWNNTLGDGNEDLAYKLANAGYKVILSNVTHLYFDMAHYKSFDEPGYYWGAFSDVDKPFSFIPYDYFKNAKVDRDGLPVNRNIFIGKQRLTDYGKSNIAGIQGALWGENIKTTGRLEYMMLPRLLGLAERAWSKDPAWATEQNPGKSDSLYNQAWSQFVNVLGKRELPRLSWYNGGYQYRVPKPGIILQDGKFMANTQFPGFVIRYTTNGRDPDEKSPVFSDVDGVNGSMVKFRAFDTKGRGSNVSEPVILK